MERKLFIKFAKKFHPKRKTHSFLGVLLVVNKRNNAYGSYGCTRQREFCSSGHVSEIVAVE